MGRFKQNLYNVQIVVFNNGRNMYVESDDGTLFSGTHRTKILPQDLPEWYAFGRYYKRFGYMSTKYIKYPKNSNCQRWMKRETSRRIRNSKCVPRKGNYYRRLFDYWWTMY